MINKCKLDSVTIYRHGITELQISKDRHTIVLWVVETRQEINRSLAAIVLKALIKRSKPKSVPITAILIDKAYNIRYKEANI